MDVVLFDRVRWLWGLTCDLWAENAENKNRQRQRQLNQSFGPSWYTPSLGRAVGLAWLIFRGLKATAPSGFALRDEGVWS